MHQRRRPPAVPALPQRHSRQGARQSGAGRASAPVLAAPSTSRPASRCGIVRAWTSVISLKPCASTAACVGALSSRPANSAALMMPLTRASTRSGTTTSAPFFFCSAMTSWVSRLAGIQKAGRSHGLQVQDWGAPSSAEALCCRLWPHPALHRLAPEPRQPRPAQQRWALRPLAPPAWPWRHPPPAGFTECVNPLRPQHAGAQLGRQQRPPPAQVPCPRSASSCTSALAAALPTPELPALQH